MAMQKTFPLFQLISHFPPIYSWTSIFQAKMMESWLPQVMTGLKQHSLSTFFGHFHSKQYLYNRNCFFFYFWIFFSLNPTARDLQCFFCCKKFCEIVWNNLLEVEQITLLKLPRRGPDQKTVKPQKIQMWWWTGAYVNLQQKQFACSQSSPLPFQDQIFNGCKHRSTNILPNSEIDFKQILYSPLHIHWNFRYVSILITETTTI